MRKPKVIGRYIRMHVFFSGKKMILTMKDVLDKKSPMRSYDIKEEDIDAAGNALDKVFKVIESCKYIEQTEVAERFVKAYKESFPFALVIEKILLRKLEIKRQGLNFWEHIEENELSLTN